MSIEKRVLRAMRAAGTVCRRHQDRPIAQQSALVQGIFTATLQQAIEEAIEIVEDYSADAVCYNAAQSLRDHFGIEKEEE